MQRLSLKIEHQPDGAVLVRCSGHLVAGVTDLLRTEVKRLMPDTRHIILDLAELEKMDSMGLGSIVSLYVSAKSAGCDLELIQLNKKVREMLGITGLLSVFEQCGSSGVRLF